MEWGQETQTSLGLLGNHSRNQLASSRGRGKEREVEDRLGQVGS